MLLKNVALTNENTPYIFKQMQYIYTMASLSECNIYTHYMYLFQKFGEG
jgi:hypothetical protein